MSIIKEIKSREILDSRGNPTTKTTIITNSSYASASVPSGASTGIHEVKELRDKGKRYQGLGVQKAVKKVITRIQPLIKGLDVTNQREIDSLMIEKDGRKNKSNLGANSILSVSLACARAASFSEGKPLYEYLNGLPQVSTKARLPRLFFNIINGGKHADNKLAIQEFMISPNKKTIKENIQIASDIYHTLKKDLHKKYGRASTNVGDEGGFAPLKLSKTKDALNMVLKAIKHAGYQGEVDIAIDAAASEFYKSKKYHIDGKKLSKEQLHNYYIDLIENYPLISIEDPFEQEDFESFHDLLEATNIHIVGDDLTVTTPGRIQRATKRKSCNTLLLKVNQIGTLTQAIEAANLAFEAGWNVMVSHRSGETEDPFIADLAVALGCGMIKAGAPCRGERTSKYNQLLRIEEDLKGR